MSERPNRPGPSFPWRSGRFVVRRDPTTWHPPGRRKSPEPQPPRPTIGHLPLSPVSRIVSTVRAWVVRLSPRVPCQSAQEAHFRAASVKNQPQPRQDQAVLPLLSYKRIAIPLATSSCFG